MAINKLCDIQTFGWFEMRSGETILDNIWSYRGQPPLQHPANLPW